MKIAIVHESMLSTYLLSKAKLNLLCTLPLPVFVNAVQMDAEQPLDEDLVPSFNQPGDTEQFFPDIRSSPVRHPSWQGFGTEGVWVLCPAPHSPCSRGIGLSLAYLLLAFLTSVPDDFGPEDASVSYHLSFSSSVLRK